MKIESPKKIQNEIKLEMTNSASKTRSSEENVTNRWDQMVQGEYQISKTTQMKWITQSKKVLNIKAKTNNKKQKWNVQKILSL